MPISVTVVFSPGPRTVSEVDLQVREGATLRDALDEAGVLKAFPQVDLKRLAVGVWGRKAALTHILRANDRVEIYRPLLVDPKVARRERFSRQGARGTGLFAKRRVGAKAGY